MAILLAGSSLAVSAQVQTTFGIKGGVNFAKIVASGSDGNTNVSVSSGTLTSFSAGVFADSPISNEFSIQPALLYSVKGGDSNDGNSTGKLKLNYLQIPVNFVYNAPLGFGKVFIGAGPYAAYALSGKVQDIVGNNTVSVDVTFGDDADSDFKRMDFGATALAGVKFSNGLLLNVSYDLGLSNISPGLSGDASIKNRVFGISAGFSF